RVVTQCALELLPVVNVGRDVVLPALDAGGVHAREQRQGRKDEEAENDGAFEHESSAAEQEGRADADDGLDAGSLAAVSRRERVAPAAARGAAFRAVRCSLRGVGTTAVGILEPRQHPGTPLREETLLRFAGTFEARVVE